MDKDPRPEKVAVVDEVRERLSGADGALLTEYRGLNVSAMAQLRRSLRQAGGEYKIFKNTLVRFAARDLGLEIEELLIGPTAIAFVDGDPVNVAKALRDFTRTNPALVVKGGLLGTKLLTADEARALADVAPREVLLAQLAGAMAAPMQQFAGLLQALPRNLAYGLKALIDQRGGVIEIPPESPSEVPPEAPEADTAPIADTTDTAEEAPSPPAETETESTEEAADESAAAGTETERTEEAAEEPAAAESETESTDEAAEEPAAAESETETEITEES